MVTKRPSPTEKRQRILTKLKRDESWQKTLKILIIKKLKNTKYNS